MSVIYKHDIGSYPKKLNELDKNVNVKPTFKHLLKCDSCLWKITFYEAKGCLPVNSKKIQCPICKEKEMNFIKLKIIS